ncbi:MAG: hypothetical protein R6V57_01910 [Vicinamibacterales bacterium]
MRRQPLDPAAIYDRARQLYAVIVTLPDGSERLAEAMVAWGGSGQAVGSLAQQFAQALSGLGMHGDQIIPLSALPWQSAAEPVTIAELRRRGVLMPPVTGDHVLSGGFAREIARSTTLRPVDQRDEYSAREGGAESKPNEPQATVGRAGPEASARPMIVDAVSYFGLA